MCCSSSDDYYTVTPYRPSDERPHPSVSREWYSELSPWDLEDIEKWQRQAKATKAAKGYGWPTARGGAPRSIDHRQTPGSRDSLMEASLARRLAAIPGAHFYEPQQPQRQRNYSPNPPRPTQRPPYYEQRVVNQQPGRMPPMNAPPMRAQPKQRLREEPPVVHQRPAVSRPPRHSPPVRVPPRRDVRAEPPMVHRRPGMAREVVVQKQPSPPPEPETARFSSVPQPTRNVRRDSNCVSLLSEDGIDFPRGCVSPIPSEPETARFYLVPQQTRSVRRDSNCVSLLSEDGIDFPRGCVSPMPSEP
ncbi:hypothetical protein CHU98_g12070 [Xylaria longipes]|nr:hypothetical protein CHU98_g12070 [Xylaria longipes]